MRTETSVRKIFICDICGDNNITNPDMTVAYPSVKHEFFHEEPSFGDGSDSENELYKLVHDKSEDEDDKWNQLAEIARTDTVEMCEECFDNYDEPNLITEFDKALRQRRGEILNLLIKEGKVLPGFSKEKDQAKSFIQILNKKREKLLENIKDNIKRDVHFEHYLDELIAIQQKVMKLKGEGHED